MLLLPLLLLILLDGFSGSVVWARKGVGGLVFLDDKGQKSELKVDCADFVQFLHQGYSDMRGPGGCRAWVWQGQSCAPGPAPCALQQ